MDFKYLIKKRKWLLTFDFKYNKDLARKHLSLAIAFFKSAELALNNKLLAPFIDNLYSAAELLAKSELLLHPDKKILKKATHKSIQQKYINYVKIGIVYPRHCTVLNKLSGLRISARYLRSALRIVQRDANNFLKEVKKMIDHLEIKLST